VVDNNPSLYFPLTEEHQPHPSHMAGLQNSHVTGLQNSHVTGLQNSHVTGLQNSLASLRVSSSNFSSSSGEQLSPRNFPTYSLTTPSPSLNYAQSVPLARPPPPSAAGLEPSRQGYAAAAQLEASGLAAASQQQQYAHARHLEESTGTPAAAYGFRRSSLDASAAAAPPAGYSSSMFGLGDISARIRQEAAAGSRTLLPAAGGEPPVSHPSAATVAAAGTTVAHGGWNPLMSGAAPAVLVHPRPQTDHTAGQESVADPTGPAAEEDSASDVNPIEEYIFYSDDDEESSSSSSSSTERRPPNDDGLQFSSSLQLAAATGSSSVVNRVPSSAIKKKKQRSLSSSGKTGSLLTQRTAASLDADLRPPSPPPSAQLSTAPLTGGGLTKVTSWSQIVGNATKPAAVPWTAAAVSPAPFLAASPSPPPPPQQQLRGKSVSPPLLPEFHRGPKVDPRWPVSQQVFLGKRNFSPFS
jgi:hypothetical protein